MTTFAAAFLACNGGPGAGAKDAQDAGGCSVASCATGSSLDESACRCVQDNAAGGQSGAGSGGSGNSIGMGGSGGAGCGLATCSAGYVLDATACACVVDSTMTSLPKQGSWTVVNRVGAPSPRVRHTIVWTGSEYAVWGGTDVTGATVFGDGALYAMQTRTPAAIR